MKIKTKKQFTLPQLIEWAWENDIRNKGFESKRNSRAYFDYDGYLSCTRAMGTTDTFTIEVEEEITEDTEIKGLVELGNDGDGTDFFQCNGSSINEQKDFDSKAFYILNEDLTMTLIWRDGRLIK